MGTVGVILLGIVLMISIFARRRVAAVMERYQGVELRRGRTGADVARAMLKAGGLDEEVMVVESRGMLPDAYDAARRRVYLKAAHFHGTGATAIGVAAHETAHALQHKDSFTALSFRLSAIKLSQVMAGIVLILAIVMMAVMKRGGIPLGILGGVWAVFMVMNLMTLGVEFEASRRAKRLLKKFGVLNNRDEGEAVSKVMGAMALANVGAMVSSLPYIIYHLLPGFGRKPIYHEGGAEDSADDAPVRRRSGKKAEPERLEEPRVIDVEPEIVDDAGEDGEEEVEAAEKRA